MAIDQAWNQRIADPESGWLDMDESTQNETRNEYFKTTVLDPMFEAGDPSEEEMRAAWTDFEATHPLTFKNQRDLKNEEIKRAAEESRKKNVVKVAEEKAKEDFESRADGAQIKPGTVRTAEDIRKLEREARTGFSFDPSRPVTDGDIEIGKNLFKALGSGGERIAAGLTQAVPMTAGLIYDTFALPQNIAAKWIGRPDMQVRYRDIANAQLNPLRFYEEAADDLVAASRDLSPMSKFDEGIVESFGKGDIGEGSEKLAYSVVENLPQYLFLAASVATGQPQAGLALLSSSAAGGEFQELKTKEGLNDALKYLNAGTKGLSEFFWERLTTLPAISKLVKGGNTKQLKAGILNGLNKWATRLGIIEGAGEGLTEMTNNITDIVTGNRNENGELPGVMDNVPDVTLVGAVAGQGMGIADAAINARGSTDIATGEVETPTTPQQVKRENVISEDETGITFRQVEKNEKADRGDKRYEEKKVTLPADQVEIGEPVQEEAEELDQVQIRKDVDSQIEKASEGKDGERRAEDRITLMDREIAVENIFKSKGVDVRDSKIREAIKESASDLSKNQVTDVESKAHMNQAIEDTRNLPAGQVAMNASIDFNKFKRINDKMGETWVDRNVLREIIIPARAYAEELGINLFHQSGDELSLVDAIKDSPESVAEYVGKVKQLQDFINSIEIKTPDGSFHMGLSIALAPEFGKAAETLKESKKVLGNNSIAIDKAFKEKYNIEDVQGKDMVPEMDALGLPDTRKGDTNDVQRETGTPEGITEKVPGSKDTDAGKTESAVKTGTKEQVSEPEVSAFLSRVEKKFKATPGEFKDVAPTETENKVIRLAQRAFGKDVSVRLIDAGDKFNGTYDPDTRTAYLNVKSTQALPAVLAHEWSHYLEGDKKAFGDVSRVIVEELKPGALAQFKIDAGLETETDEKALNELVADTISERVFDKGLWFKLHEAAPKAVKTFLKKLRRIIGKLAFTKEFRTSKMFKDLKRVQKTIDDVVAGKVTEAERARFEREVKPVARAIRDQAVQEFDQDVETGIVGQIRREIGANNINSADIKKNNPGEWKAIDPAVKAQVFTDEGGISLDEASGQFGMDRAALLSELQDFVFPARPSEAVTDYVADAEEEMARDDVNKKYPTNKKFHGPVPEVNVIDVAPLKRMNGSEVATVSDEVAESMDFTEPIDVSVFSDGEQKISDGHHRVAAARKLGIKSLPVNLTSINAKGKDIQSLIKNQPEEEMARDDDIPFQVSRLWHGTPHDVKKFSTEKIGTGEGAQAFGWGLYFTDKKGIAEDYAKRLGKAITADVQFPGGLGIQIKAMIQLYLNNTGSKNEAIKQLGKSIITSEANGQTDDMVVYQKAISALDKIPDSDIDFVRGKRRLYEVTLHEGKTPSEYEYMEWGKNITRSQRQKIADQAIKEGLDLAYKNEKGKAILNTSNEVTGRDYYKNDLNRAFNSDKEKSLFLLRAGVDGIKYPTGTLSGIQDSKDFNYVVFDENAITIDESIRFQQPRRTKAEIDIIQKSITSMKQKLARMDTTLPEDILSARASLELKVANLSAERAEWVRNEIYDYAKKIGLRGEPFNRVDTLLKNSETVGEFNKALKVMDETIQKRQRSRTYKDAVGLVKKAQKYIAGIEGKKKARTDQTQNEQIKTYLNSLTDVSDSKYENLKKTYNHFINNPEESMPDSVKRDMGVLLGRNLKAMSISEMAGVISELKHLMKEGKLKWQLKAEQQARQIENDVDAIRSEVQVTEKEAEKAATRAGRQRQVSDRIIGMAKKYGWDQLRPEHIVKIFGNYKKDVFYGRTFKKMLAAENEQAVNTEQALKKFEDVYQGIDIPKTYTEKPMTLKQHLFTFQGKEFTKDWELSINDMMFIYANSQNPGNLAHLKGTGFTDSEIEEVIKKLPGKYRRAVDKQIKYFDEVQYPRMSKAFAEEHNISMPKEVNYFPISNLDTDRAENAVMADLIARMSSKRASVGKGSTIGRVHSKSAFKKMDYFETVVKNLIQSEHYIAYNTAIREVNALLTNPDVKDILEARSEQGYKHLMDWVKATAYGRVRGSEQGIDRIFDWLRKNYVTAVLGFNLVTAAKQGASLAQGMSRVNNKYMLPVAMAMINSPIKTNKMINEMSLMMRNRSKSYERDMAEIAESNQVAKAKGTLSKWNKFKELSMWHIQAIDKATVNTLWLGKFNEVLEREGGRISEKDAFEKATAAADELIRTTQPMGGIMHLPAAHRSGGATRALTMFTNQLNQNFNLHIEMAAKAKKEGISKQGIKEAFWINMIPAAIIAMMSSGLRPPWKDPEGFFETWLQNMVGGLPLVNLGMKIGARKLTNVVRKNRGIKPEGFGLMDARIAPLAAFERMKRAAQAKKWQTATEQLVMMATELTGAPSAQIRRTVKNTPAIRGHLKNGEYWQAFQKSIWSEWSLKGPKSAGQKKNKKTKKKKSKFSQITNKN